MPREKFKRQETGALPNGADKHTNSRVVASPSPLLPPFPRPSYSPSPDAVLTNGRKFQPLSEDDDDGVEAALREIEVLGRWDSQAVTLQR